MWAPPTPQSIMVDSVVAYGDNTMYCVNLVPRLYDVIIHPCYTITQAALPKRNESVLAIQPHQADQPDGMDSLKINHATSGGGGGLWRTLLIWGTVVLTVLILAAVAPICHYSRLRPFNFGVEAAPQMVQRLVGELDFFLIIFFSFSF